MKIPDKQIVWKRKEAKTETLEVLSLKNTRLGDMMVHSHISGILNDLPILIRYRVVIDSQWRVKEIEINSLLEKDKRIYLISDTKGTWFESSNVVRKDLEGAIDIDISLTPFTNTLPINRIPWESTPGKVIVSPVFFDLENWEVKKVSQRYAKKSRQLFKYEGIFRAFMADLPTDEFGLIIDYPGVFERLYPEP